MQRSTLRDNAGFGVFASGGTFDSVIRVDCATITHNGNGVGSGAGGAVLSRGNNMIEGIGTDGTPSRAYNPE